MCSILLTTCQITYCTARWHTRTVDFNVLSLSIPVCVMDEGASTERAFTLDQIFRSQMDSDLDIRCWVMMYMYMCMEDMCLWHVTVCMLECVCVCVPQRSDDMSAPIYRMEVKSYCSVNCAHEADTSDINSHYFMSTVGAVSTHTLVQVKRSDSSMFGHICRVLLRVQIWTWCKSYVQRERISGGLLTRNWTPLHLNRYRIRRKVEKNVEGGGADGQGRWWIGMEGGLESRE